MNRVPNSDPNSEALGELRALLSSAAHAAKQRAIFGEASRAAALRLARACYGQDNSQAVCVARCLASIYNGSDARPVRLDEIRWLDWSLERDLVTVLLGTGHAGFEDSDIREAFRSIGGVTAVDWFHWYTSGGPHRAALARLVSFAKLNPDSSSSSSILSALRSLFNGSAVLNLSHLALVESELGADLSLVLDGFFGRDSGTLRSNDISEAFAVAGIPDALSSPKSQNLP